MKLLPVASIHADEHHSTGKLNYAFTAFFSPPLHLLDELFIVPKTTAMILLAVLCFAHVMISSVLFMSHIESFRET